jgi:hypothetical protein
MGIKINARSGQALIRTPSMPLGNWLAVGAEFDGWKLSEVREDSVVLATGEVKRELRLYADPTAGAAKQSSPKPQ